MQSHSISSLSQILANAFTGKTTVAVTRLENRLKTAEGIVVNEKNEFAILGCCMADSGDFVLVDCGWAV